MPSASSGKTAKPSPARRIAAAATWPKLSVPWSRRAVIQASGAAGTTVRSSPRGIVPSCSRMNSSGGNDAGHVPRPSIVSVSPSAVRIMIGATPAKLTSSACRTASAMPAQQPASTAFPPASRIAAPAAVAR
jgi:hypothetical protein